MVKAHGRAAHTHEKGKRGELVLGPWQKIVLIEFGGPRERTIAVNFL
jgi:thiamine phosphate synthase YjbQ (UPF0047 family)